MMTAEPISAKEAEKMGMIYKVFSDDSFEEGFENLTLLNYLLSIGTSNNLSNEKDINQLVKNFKIDTLASSSPKFSINVLKSLNKEIIQSYDFSDIKQKFLDLDIKDANESFWIFIKNNISFFSESLDWINVIKSTVGCAQPRNCWVALEIILPL